MKCIHDVFPTDHCLKEKEGNAGGDAKRRKSSLLVADQPLNKIDDINEIGVVDMAVVPGCSVRCCAPD